MNALIRFKNLAPLFVIALSLVTATATTTDIIFSFEEDNGEYADTDLEVDSAGNIYGTTVLGGDHGGGTVFQLTSTANGWVQNVLYSFTGGADGGEPYKGVSIDRQGNLYGTAVTGGSGSCEGGCGVVYKLTNSGGTWTQTVIHAFTGGDDGSGPGARVTVDRNGDIYGMTPTGGTYGVGTIYKIHPDAGTWDFQVIHTFTGGADGSSGSAGRMFLNHGRLYGAATTGGLYGSWSCFRAHTDTSWRMGFQDALFLPRATGRKFPLRRVASRCFGKILWDHLLRWSKWYRRCLRAVPPADWRMARESDLQLSKRKRRQQPDQQSCFRRGRQSLWNDE